MNPLWILQALEFGRKYWGQASAVLAVLFLVLAVRGCASNADLQARLAACEKRPPVVQYQTVTVTAKAVQSVKIVYKDGSPCPDVEANNDSEAVAFVSQSQTAQGGSTGRKLGAWSFSAGAAGYRGGVYGALGGGYWVETPLGDLGLEASLLYPWSWEESQVTRRPAGMVGLTIRP